MTGPKSQGVLQSRISDLLLDGSFKVRVFRMTHVQDLSARSTRTAQRTKLCRCEYLIAAGAMTKPKIHADEPLES
ncbi:hypothetical protein EVAR_35552_1 [Eumeta japonica]|uniref:Uncharacterized protein n=1 Tax=Eumeta variegata TaxID=151549 RepID=A0A4C1XLZ8_EUMVA|nr:hypothetical protein EVAR_35552_1 [Eumeta japonica]